MPLSAEDFLKMEYPQSIDLIKFYDTRQNELVKFASGISAAVPTAVLAFRTPSPSADAAVWDFTALVAFVTGLSLLSIFAALVQNRLYFVFPARQANAIRAHGYGATVLNGTPQNHMYTSVTFPAFKAWSSQTFQLLFVAPQIGSFLGIGTYALKRPASESALECAIAVGLATVVVAMGAAAWYLSYRTGTADKAVHGG